jgi:hypothetical protein
MGADKAQHLFNGVLVNRLWSGAFFVDARNAAVADAQQKAAQGFVGFNQTDVCTVRNAYAAIGLGGGDRDCDGVEDSLDPDQDGDGDPDTADNCLIVWNPGQENADRDAQGDACDPDDDNDGRNDPQDNCPWVANPGWADWNGDGQGDACDDSDGDGRVDNGDNCRTAPNPGQEDQDLDNIGDACDTDRDGDGWGNNKDNCPRHANMLQEDSTEQALGLPRDGVGDACDLCPAESDPDNTDLDGDGLANPCDDDDDGDGVADADDNCPLKSNPGQADFDDDDVGFACDPDEQQQFGGYFADINQRYVRVQNFSQPIPVCPACVGNYLSARYEILIQVQLPIGFEASVTDSSGAVVAKGTGTGQIQTLRISPRPFAVTQLGGAGGQTLSGGAGGLPMTEYGPDAIRYNLEIEPAPGTDLSVPYPLTLHVEERIEGGQVYLPLVARQP